MQTIKAGARVRTERDIRGLARVSVPRGTEGIVLEVRDFGSVIVAFDNGRQLGVSEAFLAGVAFTPGSGTSR